ncbi:MAG: cysteine hydrolase family protein [Chloroflexota bacterium]
MNTALLIIDIQNDYFPGGKMELESPMAAALKAGALLQCFREHGRHHIHIQHEARNPGASFFIPSTDGIRIHDTVAHFENEPIVHKQFPNSFRDTNLLELLKNWKIERVVICGMMTHMCVDATVRAAADLGLQVLVAEDACATKALTYGEVTVPASHVQAAFLAAFKSYGTLMTTEDLLSMLGAEQDK